MKLKVAVKVIIFVFSKLITYLFLYMYFDTSYFCIQEYMFWFPSMEYTNIKIMLGYKSI